MSYYNRKLKMLKINIDKFDYIGHGFNAYVYHNNKMALKRYYRGTLPRLRLSPELFDLLKDVRNKHFIRLYDIYCELDNKGLEEYNSGGKNFSVDAYTSKYYRRDGTEPLLEKKEYLLENIRELEALFTIFTNEGIITDDIKRENSIFQRKRIIIIDPDLYYIDKNISKKERAIINKRKLLLLFGSICIDELQEAYFDKKAIKEYMEYLDINKVKDYFTKVRNDIGSIQEIDENTNVTDRVAKILEKVNRPIDYLAKIT